MYKVIHFFTDLQDFDYPYDVGDIFPRHGKEVSEERLEELSTDKNRQRRPLIKKTEDVVGVKEQKYTKSSINRLSTAELRELAKECNIHNAEETTGAELKKKLIDLLV